MKKSRQSIFVGDKYCTRSCGDVVVLEYHSAKDVDVRFVNTGYTTTTQAGNLRNGSIRDITLPSVHGAGFYREGIFKARLPNSKCTWVYLKWARMIERCYDAEYKILHPAYAKSTSSPEWLDFQNFAEWSSSQIGYGNEGWHIDKDILVRGNKEYSAEKCCFVPQELNVLINKAESCRGHLPIGVSLLRSKRYVAHICLNSVVVHLGVFDDAVQAFEKYKSAKEVYIQQQANKWKEQIDPRVYNALMRYQVLITD